MRAFAGAAFAPLRSPPYRRLMVARTVSVLGNAVAPVALAFAVLDLGGSASALGVVVGARSAANVLFLLLGGVIADRAPRKLVLVGSSTASALTQAAVAAVVIARVDSVLLLAALSAVNGMVAGFAMPASAALLPATVDRSLLRQANALARAGSNTAMVLGAAAAGVLVAALGPGWCIGIDAATFAAAGAVYAATALPAPASAPAGDTGPPSRVWAELAQGWVEFRSRTWLWVVVSFAMIGNAAYVGAVQVLGPVVADHSIGRKLWGLVLAALTLGLVTGALLAIRVRPTHPLRFALTCLPVIAATPLLLGTAPVFAALAGAAFATGIALEQFTVTWEVTLQHHIPPERLARAYSYDMLGSYLAIPLGQIAIGPISRALGVRATLIGAATVIVLTATAALGSRAVRNLPASETPRQPQKPRPPATAATTPGTPSTAPKH